MRWPKLFLYRAVKKLAALRYAPGRVRPGACVVWPPVRTESEMRWLSRWVSWYLPPQTQLCVTVPVEGALVEYAELKDYEGFADNVAIVRWPTAARQFDAILLHRMGLVEAIRALWFFDGRVQSIDRGFWDVEESLAFENIFRTQQTKSLSVLRDRLAEVSLENYARLFQTYHGSEQAFVFATGPSLRNAFKLRFRGDELTIICNSIVKDRELLEHIRPKILTFADQVFHFGPSDYAVAFRHDALRVIQEYQCKCIVPEDRALLLALHYPEIVDDIIAMPLGRQLNFPTPGVLYVEPTENIMTLFMIPVASALARKVYFCGADGRTPGERYFWQHDDRAQYQSLLQNAVEWHPSFFRDRHMEAYYSKHCDTLERQLVYGEARGIHYISLTRSKIPALAQRYAADALDMHPQQ